MKEMVKCCLPYCDNKRRANSNTSVSFHEFPSNIQLRSKWIESVRIPTSLLEIKERIMICSAHFKSTDYRDGTKRRVLKYDAVPSVFNYQANTQSFLAPKKQMYPKSKDPLNLPVLVEPEATQAEIKNDNESISLLDNNSSSSSTSSSANRTEITVLTSIPSSITEGCENRVPVAVKERKKKHSRFSKLKQEVLSLKLRLKLANNEINAMKPKVQQLLRIEEEARNGNQMAVFLQEQVNAFGKTDFNWTETTIGEYMIIRTDLET